MTPAVPAVSAEQIADRPVLEKHTIAQIPLDERHGRPRDLFTIWFGSNIMPLTFVTGALATTVYNLPFWWAVIALAVGNLVGGLFMALHSAQGPRLGVPQMIQSRGQFGTLGAVIVVLIAVVMYVGFFASNLILGGESIHGFVGGVSSNWGIVICAVGSGLITIFGYDLIHSVNKLATLLFGAAMLLAFIWVLGVHGLPAGFGHKTVFSGGPFLATVSIAVLWQIAYAPYVSDYSRYMPRDEGIAATFWSSYWGCTIGSIFPMILGALVGLASTLSDPIMGLSQLTGTVAGIILLIFALGIIDTNSINLYGGVLCSITVAETFRPRWLPGAPVRAVLAVAIVVLSLIIALAGQTNFLANYTNFILLLLYVLIPWTAINLVDYYLIRKGQYHVPSFFDPTGGIYGRVNAVAVAVYLIGIVVQIPFMNTSLYQGPVSKALNGADLAWLVGLAVTIPLYYISAKMFTHPEPTGDVALGHAGGAGPGPGTHLEG